MPNKFQPEKQQSNATTKVLSKSASAALKKHWNRNTYVNFKDRYEIKTVDKKLQLKKKR